MPIELITLDFERSIITLFVPFVECLENSLNIFSPPLLLIYPVGYINKQSPLISDFIENSGTILNAPLRLNF